MSTALLPRCFSLRVSGYSIHATTSISEPCSFMIMDQCTSCATAQCLILAQAFYHRFAEISSTSCSRVISTTRSSGFCMDTRPAALVKGAPHRPWTWLMTRATENADEVFVFKVCIQFARYVANRSRPVHRGVFCFILRRRRLHSQVWHCTVHEFTSLPLSSLNPHAK